MKNREFSNEGSIEDRMKRYEERANPVAQFIRERCIADPNEKIPLFQFFNELKVYLTQRGHRVISKIELGRLLRNDGYVMEKENVQVDERYNKDQRYTKWLYIYGITIKEKDKITGYQSGSRPNSPNRPKISTTPICVWLSENQGLLGLQGLQNSEKSKSVAEIHHKCTSCGNEPSHTYDSHGKPICNDCANTLLANGIQVDIERIEDDQ